LKADDAVQLAKKRLVSANHRFGYRGGEEDQAWELLVLALGREPDDEEIPASVRRRYNRLIERRCTGEPMAYLTGSVEFSDFSLGIKPGMFVPRLTSEFLATQAIRRLRSRRQPVHADVATGIGPVAIASARAVRHAHVYGLDISERAISQARANAAQLEAGNVSFHRSDMFSSLAKNLRGEVDVVTIHPPYVARREVATLPEEIKRFEPKATLTDGSADGLGLVRRVAAEGAEWIRPGGWLLIEIVPGYFNHIRPLMRDAGFSDIRSTCGPMRYTRVIAGRLRA
jgi:release factor glutamine methyltransferase